MDDGFAQTLQKIKARPKIPQLEPDVEKAVIKQFHHLPKDRKHIIRTAMQHPCPNCEHEFGLPIVGKSHGICPRHFGEMYRSMGMEPPPTQGKTVDLALLSPEERTLISYLFSIVMRRQKAKGTF